MMTSTLSVLMLPIKYLFLKSAHSSQYNNNTTTPLIIVRHALCYEVKYCAFSRNNNNISIRISIYCHALCSVRVACCVLRVACCTDHHKESWDTEAKRGEAVAVGDEEERGTACL